LKKNKKMKDPSPDKSPRNVKGGKKMNFFLWLLFLLSFNLCVFFNS
jgi:hypothetical protein